MLLLLLLLQPRQAMCGRDVHGNGNNVVGMGMAHV